MSGKATQGDLRDSREDHELIAEIESDVGDVVRIWRVTFPDPNPVRVEVLTDDGRQAEVWLSDSNSTTLSRALEVIR